MGKITEILRKHFKSCQKSSEAKKLADRLGKKQQRGGTAPKKTAAPLPKVPVVKTPKVKSLGFRQLPRHGNSHSGSEV
jgi:hypothetical protein